MAKIWRYKRGDFTDAFRGWLWSGFRKSIIHGQRFFNQRANDTLKEIFDGVHRQQDQQGEGAVYLIGPGSEKAALLSCSNIRAAYITGQDSRRHNPQSWTTSRAVASRWAAKSCRHIDVLRCVRS